MDDGIDARLQRVHVAGARAVKDGFVVVISDPVLDAAGGTLRADTWEVSWEAWVRSGARIADL